MNTLKLIPECVGKLIRGISINDTMLTLRLNNDTELILTDQGQDCCERRYMHTDDNLTNFFDSILLNIRIVDGPSIENEDYGYNDSQFLIVDTSKGSFTVVNYNKHNGFYYGFDIQATLRN